MSQITIRKEALFVLKTLREAGYDAYIVGGAVRDIFLTNNSQTDYDFTTNAKPEEINALFPESFYENQFGTVSITHRELLAQMGLDPSQTELSLLKPQSDQRVIDIAAASKIHESLSAKNVATDSVESYQFLPDFEITTYRSQEIYADFRRPDPEQLTWGQTIDEDLARRDFTINAMALSVDDQFLANLDTLPIQVTVDHTQATVIDPYLGMNDLNQRLIKTVGNPSIRFQEDALRMLRAIRFAVQLNMTIEANTFAAITEHRQLLEHISWERIGEEFMKMMKSDHPAEAIVLLDESNLLRVIMPELLAGKGVQQAGHHTTDVWTHSLDALKESPSKDPVVRLATLIHDIGKPPTYQEENGKITFYNHEIVGSRIASEIAKRLRLSKNNVQRIFTLVRYHMFYYQPTHTDAAVRRFMRRVGLENIDDMLDLREADRLGSGARKTSWRLEEMKQRMIEQLHQPMAVTDLAINGTDLMNELGLQPGPVLGKILQNLLDLVLEHPEFNTREQLLQKSKELVS